MAAMLTDVWVMVCFRAVLGSRALRATVEEKRTTPGGRGRRLLENRELIRQDQAERVAIVAQLDLRELDGLSRPARMSLRSELQTRQVTCPDRQKPQY